MSITDIDELDRIWREGLARLATPVSPQAAAAEVAEPAANAEVLAERRRRRRGTLAAAAVVLAVVVALGLAVTNRHSSATVVGSGTTVPSPRPLVVEVVDGFGGATKISFPGLSASGNPPRVELPAGLVQFDVRMFTPGHSLVLDGVPGFAVDGQVAGVYTQTVQLRPGLYKLHCTVPGHADVGEQILVAVS